MLQGAVAAAIALVALVGDHLGSMVSGAMELLPLL